MGWQIIASPAWQYLNDKLVLRSGAIKLTGSVAKTEMPWTQASMAAKTKLVVSRRC